MGVSRPIITAFVPDKVRSTSLQRPNAVDPVQQCNAVYRAVDVMQSCRFLLRCTIAHWNTGTSGISSRG
ncbi:hypothetical protein PAXRUDRAFT_700824 [Paxillus rubicundulus Ve08.2h10]|uniref:Uncharacterized protein n=1 Tax=Paxillus rubicundulus Ve08.2h10 TaxID=930991 RepID=A0A0D0DNL1_9AGAM|nr:hypothetical protein PAXRUDRAFT_700824 [Paxillus rubicundulus Ve08.2h10]